MSMYGDYIKERLGDGIVERAEGFATYRFMQHENEPAVYIVDIYVRPDFRKGCIASEMANEIVDRAKKLGCKWLLGTVCPAAKNSTASLRVLLGYGMDLHSSSNDLIIFKKGI